MSLAKHSFSAGDRVEYRGRKALGERWRTGEVVTVDGRDVEIRARGGLVVIVDASLCRRPKNMKLPPSSVKVKARAPVTTAPTTTTTVERAGDFAKRQVKSQPKPTGPARSEAYKAFVRTKPCCRPGCKAKAPSDPHHAGKRGVGQKCSDFRTVPLCRADHRFITDKNTLPGMNAATTRALFAARIIELLEEYAAALETRGAA